MNVQQVPQCKQRRVTYLLTYIMFLLCIYYSPWKHTSIFIYSSWQLSMEDFPLAFCDFQTTFWKTRIKATEMWLLAKSAGHLKYWRYGKTREFQVKSSGIFWRKILFYPELSCFTVSSIFQMTSRWSLISHFRSFNSSFQKCRLKIASGKCSMESCQLL
jgi:hypothetical protein